MAILWLTSPYLSMLAICASPPLARRVADHTALTLPIGWLAVIGLLAGVVRIWTPSTAVLAVCATLSGLAMITTGGGGGGGGGGPDDDGDPPPPEVDWNRFDEARRRWEAEWRGRPPRARESTRC